MQPIAIQIPEEVTFASLELRRNACDISFAWPVIIRVCEANGLDSTLLMDTPLANAISLILSWYAAHRAAGGEINLSAEQLEAEVVARAVFGVRAAPGGATH